MATTRKTFYVTTAADGSWTGAYAVRGQLIGVAVEVGDLSTPDIDVTDETFDTPISLLSVNGIAADAVYYPQVTSTDPSDGTAGDTFFAPGIFGRVQVAVSGAGDTKHGLIHLLIAR